VEKGIKKRRKQKNVSKFVKDNLDLFKEILDPETGWMSKVKGADGRQRYFVHRGNQMVCQLNKFFMDLLEAKIEANPFVQEKNVRRSMDINAAITYLEKGRKARPGAGRKPKSKKEQPKQMSLNMEEAQPKQKAGGIAGMISGMIADNVVTQKEEPLPAPPPAKRGNEQLMRYKKDYGFPEELCKTNTDEDLESFEADAWFDANPNVPIPG
jgi:hypothetical protein